MEKRTSFPGTLASIAALFCCVVTVNGPLVAHAGFSRAFPEFTDTELVEAGIIEAVESDEGNEEFYWSHTVSHAGDYQLGMAWLEVMSGKWVHVSIRAGGETLREFAAIQDIEPVRLDQRFEGLDIGDTIEITVTPEPGTTYRLGFHLACGTPNVDGLDVFYVADFGAIGDGETDDMAAIHAAVTAARAAGGGIIRFEAGQTYRTIGLDDMTVEYVFPLWGASNISIEGNGATLILHPPDGFAEVTNARNIQIDGFFIDYWPLPYFQGDIVDIDLDNRTIDLTVADRYSVPQVGTVTNNLPFFGRPFTPDSAGARSGSGDNIYVERIERVGGDRDVRIYVPEFAPGSDTPDARMLPRLEAAKDSGATEFVVPDLQYGHRGGTSRIWRSGRILFSNLRWYRVPYFWIYVQDNIGPVSFDNVNLQMKNPETELLASWRDGFHMKNSRFGVKIDGSHIDGSAMYDDTFAIYTRVHRLLAADGNRLEVEPTFRQQKDIDTWRAGDWVSCWNADQSELRGMGRLVEVEDAIDENRFFLTLESLPEGLQADDILINEEVLNRQTLIRNSTTTNIGTGRTTTRLRASDIHYENNHFENFYFHVEFNMFWGTPRSRGVYVKDSYIDSPSPVNLLSAIRVHFENVHINRTTVRGVRAQDVRLENIQWPYVSDDIIDLINQSTAWLYGDSTRNGSSANLSNYASVDSSSRLIFDEPLHMGINPPLALLAEATGETETRLEWSAVENASSYTVYRSLRADGPFEPVAVSEGGEFVDDGLASGVTYYYAVTATDGDGLESDFSNIVSVPRAGPPPSPQDDLLLRESFDVPGGSGARLHDVGSGMGWGTNLWHASGALDGIYVQEGGLSFPDGVAFVPAGNSLRTLGTGAGRISQRYFDEGIALTQTLYASMLFNVTTNANFRFEFSNAAGNNRLSFGVDNDLTFWAGRHTHTNAEDPVKENATYLLLLKQTGSHVYATLFETGEDTVPDEEPDSWLITHASSTGVTQDFLRIVVGGVGGTAQVDEFRLGTTFESVTSYSEPPIAPDIEHASIALDGGVVVVTVTFNESGNDSYTLQFSTNLVEGVWMDAVTGVTQSPVIFTNSTPAGFFRMRAQ